MDAKVKSAFAKLKSAISEFESCYHGSQSPSLGVAEMPSDEMEPVSNEETANKIDKKKMVMAAMKKMGH